MFIPTLIAVLLAEFGGRATQFARLPRLALAATSLGIATGIAAFAGYSLAATMNGHARSLMLGIALILTGFGQFGKSTAAPLAGTSAATLLVVWRSGAPFLAFAFALWRAAPVSAAAGALCGIAAVASLGTLLADALNPTAITVLRRAFGMILTAVGSYAMASALRLIA